jgi:hypothetical protein
VRESVRYFSGVIGVARVLTGLDEDLHDAGDKKSTSVQICGCRESEIGEERWKVESLTGERWRWKEVSHEREGEGAL